MFTRLSKYVPADVKEKMIAAIRAARPTVTLTEGYEQRGRRFDDDEDCFQGLCRAIWPPRFDLFDDQEEAMVKSACATIVDFAPLAILGLKSAASCDHFYAHEKDYGTEEDRNPYAGDDLHE